MKIIEIGSHQEVIDVIREFSVANHQQPIGLRHFKASLVKKVISTGTDRDQGSKIHFFEGDLYPSPEIARRSGYDQNHYPVGADRITYMRVVDVVNGQIPLSLPLLRRPSPLVDNMNYLAKLSPECAQVLYNPHQLTRKSENEFWFNGDPLSAVLAVVTASR